MAETPRAVPGDRCSRALSALRDLDPARDAVPMAEAAGEYTYVRHHPKKIVLVLSAMRHLARALRLWRGRGPRGAGRPGEHRHAAGRGAAMRAVQGMNPARLAALRARAAGLLAAMDAGEAVWGGDGTW